MAVVPEVESNYYDCPQGDSAANLVNNVQVTGDVPKNSATLSALF